MKLTDFATKLTAQNHFIKASFGGFQGSGKSRTATEFIIGAYKDLKCNNPILIIDNEKGSRFLIPIFKKAGIEAVAKDTSNLSDIHEAFNFLASGEIAQETSDANLTPGNDLEYFENIQKRKIEIEKISAVFELNGLGSPRSAEEKKLKTMIIQKIFQTTSQTEIDKMPYTALNNFRVDLEELLKQLQDREDKIEFVLFAMHIKKANAGYLGGVKCKNYSSTLTALLGGLILFLTV